MKLVKTQLPGCFVIENFSMKDERGLFVKTLNSAFLKENRLEYEFKESFFSESGGDVIRGMHFQVPPHEHAKLVYPTSGRILDVVLDLRTDSPTYGKFEAVELSKRKSIYVPKGLAHGFCVIGDFATVVYMTTSRHSKEHDQGIRWDSFGFNWPIKDPVLSDRDRQFRKFSDYKSPFKK